MTRPLAITKFLCVTALALLYGCGGSGGEEPQLPDPLPSDSALTASLPPLQRTASDDLTGGALISLVAVAPSLYFMNGSASGSVSKVDIDFVRAICRTSAGTTVTMSELLPGASVTGLQFDAATGRSFVSPSQSSGVSAVTAQLKVFTDVPEFQLKPQQCWTEARVRVSGSAAVQVATTYRDSFAGTVRLVVFGTSAWRTVRDEWITIRTGRV